MWITCCSTPWPPKTMVLYGSTDRHMINPTAVHERWFNPYGSHIILSNDIHNPIISIHTPKIIESKITIPNLLHHLFIPKFLVVQFLITLSIFLGICYCLYTYFSHGIAIQYYTTCHYLLSQKKHIPIFNYFHHLSMYINIHV